MPLLYHVRCISTIMSEINIYLLAYLFYSVANALLIDYDSIGNYTLPLDHSVLVRSEACVCRT